MCTDQPALIPDCFHLSISVLPFFLALFIYAPAFPFCSAVLLAAVQSFFYFIYVIDSQGDTFLLFPYYVVYSPYLPLMVVIPRLLFLN